MQIICPAVLCTYTVFNLMGTKMSDDNEIYEKPSIHPSAVFRTLVAQQCVHHSKWHLLKMKAASLSMIEFTFTSLHSSPFINGSV